LLDQVIVELDRFRPQTTSFDAFLQTVYVAVGAVEPTPLGRDGARDDRVPLSVSECAEPLGVSNDTIERMIRTHTLRAFKVNKRWRIEQAEVDRLRAAHPEKYPDRTRRRNSRRS
jgi:excisionase family DNA binding protein